MGQRLAIVTGGAGDIGRAIGARLRQDHDLVILADRDLAGAERAALALGAGFRAMPVDVTNAASCAGLADLGPLTTLVNNAGAAWGASLHQTTPESWAKDRALNFDGAFLMFNALAARLVAAKGSVVNIASVNGFGVYGHPAYSAAKAGMVHLTRSIAVEYGRHGVRANAVAPGTVKTQGWEARAAENPNVFKEAAEHYALGRIVLPEDVANAVGFLASPLAAAITGVCLAVDCGLTAGIPALARTFSQTEDY
ncbi:SDR family oxidoreductase [Neogemmobacter tilapiae]|uniref:Short-chain dehydrogenase n=1 Tax=Neogemmobacter tilapiae TaxID=875041 RepID=A0A918TJI4_9RHOB|nr:SDR family oxidoreductase [Gemmobacter tilapiae]GHC50755.1 short-chain dehydrogenase [Gemmobacter tilapiae]